MNVKEPPAYKNSVLNEKYLNLSQPDDRVMVTYVWIDGTGEYLRQKTKTMNFEPKQPDDCAIWNFDGSSTDQADGANSDVYIYPVALFNDPFRLGKNKLLLCDAYKHDGQPVETNKRLKCFETMKQVADEKPWFGIEQEYCLLNLENYPIGWPPGGFPKPQGSYYCSVGSDKSFGRDVIEAHYKACMYAGINISGTNGETMPSQWEFQVGPCEGIEIGDHLWMARFILHQVAEMYGVLVSFDPKPIPGNWSGSGAHCNFSTQKMRESGGIEYIKEAIKRLESKHNENLKFYDLKGGIENQRRLTGRNETAHYSQFSSAIASRKTSVRIPRHVSLDGNGYFEDRRPASNSDPYVVSREIVKTVILQK